MTYAKEKICKNCNNEIRLECQFLKIPPWIFVQTSDKAIIYFNELPNIITISSKNYQLLCESIHRKNHFRSLFMLNNLFILLDDLKPGQITSVIRKIKVVTVFYYLIE